MSAAVAQARQIQKVYSEWCVKAAEIILASRIENPGMCESSSQTSASFNLKVPELFNVRLEAVARPEFFQLKTQRSFQVEIYLGLSADAAAANEAEMGQLVERWTFTFFPAHPEPTVPDRCNQMLVRKLGVTLRSLMCFSRLLPAYALCRASRSPNAMHCRFRVEAWPPTSRAALAPELSTQDFVSLQSSVGTLRLSVSQRKDLKSMPSSGPFRSTAAIGSQLDPIELEEAYFTSTIGPVDAPTSEAATSVGRLSKIAEEPDAKALDPLRADPKSSHYDGVEQPSLSTTPSSVVHEPMSARGDRTRPRLSSEDSIASTVSTSSKAYSSADHAVVLGATPPLASTVWTGPPPGFITLGPHHRGDSACSSRSVTPQTTPKLGPAPEPAGPPAADQRSRGVLGSAIFENLMGGADSSAGPAHSRLGEADDLRGIWMSCPPEWGSHRRSSSIGTASRRSNTQSRSPSPEIAARKTALASPSLSNTEVPGAASMSTRGSAGPTGEEPMGEIQMFGMSDDEDEDFASDEEEVQQNVVASTLQEGTGAAFATACVDPERLGLAGMDFREQSPGRLEGSGTTPNIPSPLIAQLNPFAAPVPPSLDLPPAALAGSPEEPLTAAAETGTLGTSGGAVVQGLLSEMGDLVCRLQQRHELAISSQEVFPDELLERIAHFREVAGSAELRCR